jgi:hypothetical protein
MPSIPTPLDVLRVLPRCGLQLVVPAMAVGAVWCSMLDILLGHEGYPLAMAGLVLGPVAFGLAINALHRAEARARTYLPDPDAYRATETAKRLEAARTSGVILPFEK